MESRERRTARFSRRQVLGFAGIGGAGVSLVLALVGCQSATPSASAPTQAAPVSTQAAAAPTQAVVPAQASAAVAAPTAQANAGAKTTVHIVSGEPGPATKLAFFKKEADDFSKANPNVSVEILGRGWTEFFDQLLVVLASGSGMDLFRLADIPPAASFYAKDITQPLNDLMQRDNWDLKKQIIPPYEESYWKGRINGLPRGGAGQNGYVYNIKLFDKLKVPHPTNDWTSDQFLEMAKQLTVQEGGKTVQWGADWPAWDQGMLWSNGGDFSDKGYSKCTLDAPEAIEYFQWKQDLQVKWKVCPTPDESKTITGDAFATGKVAMSNTGFWGFYDYVKLPDLDFGFVATPKFKGKQVGFSSLSAQSMWKNTKNPDAAWEFMKYLASPDVTWSEQVAGMWISISTANSTKDEFVHPKGPPHDNSASIPGMLFPGRENWFTTLVQGSEASRLYSQEVDGPLQNGKGTAADILKAIVPKMTPLIQGGATVAP